MKVIRYPRRSDWDALLLRPELNVQDLRETVGKVLNDVKQRGDEAVLGYEEQFDRVCLSSLTVSKDEMVDKAGCHLLAESCSYREGWTVYSGRHSSALFYGLDVGHPCTDCRM